MDTKLLASPAFHSWAIAAITAIPAFREHAFDINQRIEALSTKP